MGIADRAKEAAIGEGADSHTRGRAGSPEMEVGAFKFETVSISPERQAVQKARGSTRLAV